MGLNCEGCKQKCEATCCGPVPFPVGFLQSHLADCCVELNTLKVAPIGIGREVYFTPDLRCPFNDTRDNFRCTVYEERPDVCRQFGVITSLECPYQDSNGRIRSRQERRAIERKWKKKMRGLVLT